MTFSSWTNRMFCSAVRSFSSTASRRSASSRRVKANSSSCERSFPCSILRLRNSLFKCSGRVGSFRGATRSTVPCNRRVISRCPRINSSSCLARLSSLRSAKASANPKTRCVTSSRFSRAAFSLGSNRTVSRNQSAALFNRARASWG